MLGAARQAVAANAVVSVALHQHPNKQLVAATHRRRYSSRSSTHIALPVLGTFSPATAFFHLQHLTFSFVGAHLMSPSPHE